jgi:hypothetical protein
MIKRILLLLLLCSASLWATTYYVSNAGRNSNNGTSTGTSFAFSPGMSGCTSTCAGVTLAAGDTVLFNRGDTWHDQITMPSSGTAGNPITFDAYGSGAKPIFDESAQKTDFTLYSGSIYRRTGTGIIGTQVTQVFQNNVRLIKAASVGAMVQGSYQWDSTYTYVWTTDSGNPNSELIEEPIFNNAIDFNGQAYITVNNIAGKRTKNGVFNFRQVAGAHDITMNSDEASQSGFRGFDGGGAYSLAITKYNITLNNVIAYDNVSEGIWMGVGHDITITNPTVYDGHKDASKGYTNVDFCGIIIGNGATGPMTVTGAYIHDCYDGGLIAVEWESGAAAQPTQTTIQNSHFVDNQPHFSRGGNVWLNGDSTCVFRNNIVEEQASACATHAPNVISTSAGTGGGALGMKVYNNTIKQACTSKWVIATDNVSWSDNENNILRNSASNSMVAEGTYATKSIYKNNLYYGTSGTYFSSGINGTYYTTYASWAAASGDTGSVVSAPLFVNEGASDFHLQASSPAVAAGVNLVAWVPNDYVGNPRSAPFDIGAYEFWAALPAAPSGLTAVVH